MDVLTMEVPRTSALAKVEKVKVHHIGNAGLVVASIAIAPVLAFAVLWTGVLMLLGGMWLLDLVGLL